MVCIVSKLVGKGKIWDFDNGMSFDTEKGGQNGKKREELRLYQKRSLLEQPGSGRMMLGSMTGVAFV